MSKRSLELDDYNNSKKPKINENSDYIRCSPLLFFDDHVSNQDNENNNVITEMFKDNISEKNIEDITNGFSHSQSSEKLLYDYKDMENYEENGICQLLNSEIVNNCKIENVNSEIVKNCEMESINSEIENNCEMMNINSEIVNNCVVGAINSEIENNCEMMNINSEIVNNCVVGTINSEIVKICDDNGVKVDIIVPNVTESIINSTQVASNEYESLTLVESSTSHQNEELSGNKENHNDEKIFIEETSETLTNEEDHMILKDNNDSLNEKKVLPNESEDLSKVSIGASSPNTESAKTGYKLESTDLEMSKEITSPKEEKSHMIETNTPLNKRGRPRKIISEEKSPKNVIMHDFNNDETFKRRVSARIESRMESQLKEGKVDNNPKKKLAESPKNVIMHVINNNETSSVKRRLSARIESRMESQLKEEKVDNNTKKIISEESPKNVIRDINNNITSTVKRRLSSRIESRMELELKEVKVDNNNKKNSRVSSKENKTNSIDYKDPGTWPLEVPDDLKIEIIKKGHPKMESGIFPKNENNRCFAPGNYFCKMPNGERVLRFWLAYSRSQDAVYCFACRLFKPDHSSTLANVGFTNWKKLNERLINHEKNVHHSSSLDQWSQLLVNNDITKCDGVLTNEQALSMVMLLKNFLSKKSDYTYLLANELAIELENYVEDSQMNPKQE